MANLTTESDFLALEDNTASIDFDPRLIRVNPRLISLCVPFFHGAI